jgi:hypothetical protein
VPHVQPLYLSAAADGIGEPIEAIAGYFSSTHRTDLSRFHGTLPATSQRFSGYATAPLAPSKGLPTVPNSLPMVTCETA